MTAGTMITTYMPSVSTSIVRNGGIATRARRSQNKPPSTIVATAYRAAAKRRSSVLIVTVATTAMTPIPRGIAYRPLVRSSAAVAAPTETTEKQSAATLAIERKSNRIRAARKNRRGLPGVRG